MAGKSGEGGSSEESPHFHNWLYRGELGRTSAGSPVLKIAPTNPGGRFAHPRQVAAFIYEIAAEMEKRSHDLGAQWVISPDPMDARIAVELAEGGSPTAAIAFIALIIADFHLA